MAQQGLFILKDVPDCGRMRASKLQVVVHPHNFGIEGCLIQDDGSYYDDAHYDYAWHGNLICTQMHNSFCASALYQSMLLHLDQAAMKSV